MPYGKECKTFLGSGSVQQKIKNGKTYYRLRWVDKINSDGSVHRTEKLLPKDEYTLKKAKEELAKITSEYTLFGYSENTEVTVKEAFDMWAAVDGKDVKPNTLYEYRNDYERHFTKNFGDRKISEITSSELKAYYNKLSVSQKTKKNINGVFSVVFAFVFRDERIQLQNPAKAVRFPRVKQKERFKSPEFTVDTIITLLKCFKGSRFENLYKYYLYSGDRECEPLDLKWSDIDFQNNLITTERQWYRNRETGEYSAADTKEGDVRVRAMLMELRETIAKQLDAVGRMRRAAGDAWQENDLVFPKADGTHYSYRVVYDHFKKITREAGLELRIHDLRHAHASIMRKGGADWNTIRQSLGHTTEGMSKKYFTADSEYSQNQVQCVDNYLEEALKRAESIPNA